MTRVDGFMASLEGMGRFPAFLKPEDRAVLERAAAEAERRVRDMTYAVLDLENGQASIKGPTGVLDRPGLYVFDAVRDEMVWMTWADALRMALWIQRNAGTLKDMGARIAVLEDMGVWKEEDEDGED